MGSVVDLANTRLTTIPNWVYNPMVQSLDLGENSIEELPDMIEYLTNLTEFLIDSNLLCKISPNIGNLINLTSLTLSDNDLDILPETLGI